MDVNLYRYLDIFRAPGTITAMATKDLLQYAPGQELGTRVGRVLSVTEARSAMPQIAKRFRSGAGAEVVFFGSQRHADVAMIPAKVYETLMNLFEDVALADLLRERYATDDGTRVTMAELDALDGVDSVELDARADELARELGLR